MINRFILIAFAISALFLTFSCMPARKTGEEGFLKKNVIKVEGEKVDEGDLEDFVQQERNKRLLGILWFKPWLYQKLDRGKESGFNKWMKETFASRPVYYDPSLTVSSTEMMEQYLFSKGYFNAGVDFSKKEKNDKVAVTYHVKTNKPYRIRDIHYQFKDSLLKPWVCEDTAESLVSRGSRYDTYVLDDERERITKRLREKGFYRFNKEYVRYLVDSSLKNNQLDLYVQLLPRKFPSPDVPSKMEQAPHKRFQIDEVIIRPDQKVLKSESTREDTLELQYRAALSDTTTTPYTFIYDNPLRVKPKTYMRRIKVRPGDWYDFRNTQRTYNGLAGLNITRFVNIDFSQKKAGENTSDTTGRLDCRININRKPVHSFSVETEGTNTAGRPGLASRVVYQNKNLFRGGEVFDLSLAGALEAQGNTDSDNRFLIFNTIEGGVDANLTIPHFLLPVKPEFFSRDYHPYTNIHTGYNYQKRPDYVRYISNVSFGYRWRQSKIKRHILTPLDINAVKIFTEPGFEQRLQQLDKKYREQYTNHLLASLKYSFILNTQNISEQEDFVYLRANVESSGIMMDLLNRYAGIGNQLDDYNTLFNIRYAQFFRTDTDFRYYHYISNNRTLVFRTLFGIGLPYGNSVALPFEKGFYAGGANGMRGWRIRDLGPGSYQSEDNFDKIGDIQVEFNFEYRFPVYSFLNGALFVDAGNIWLLNKSDDYPLGHFNINNVMQQMAVDAGLGMRLDFRFFILRMDAAMPMRKPSEASGDRWQTLGDMEFGDVVWNFGIGYPF